MIKIIIAVSYNDNDIKNSMPTENSVCRNRELYIGTYNTIRMNAIKTKYITQTRTLVVKKNSYLKYSIQYNLSEKTL